MIKTFKEARKAEKDMIEAFNLIHKAYREKDEESMQKYYKVFDQLGNSIQAFKIQARLKLIHNNNNPLPSFKQKPVLKLIK